MIGSFDFETALIRPGLQAPPPVVLTWAVDDQVGIAPSYEADLRGLLATDTIWAGANIAFDMAVAMAWGLLSPQDVFRAYDSGRVLCLSVFERIAEIGGWTTRKDLGLASLHRVYGLGELEKGETRTSYEPLLGRPLSEYTQEQIDYAIKDSIAGLNVFKRQLERWTGRVRLDDAALLSRKQFWLYLTRAWGLQTDPERVDVLKEETTHAVNELKALAQQVGFVRANGSRDMKAIKAKVSEAYDGDPPMTKPARNRKSEKPFVPSVRTDKDTLTSSGDVLLEQLADFGSWKAIQGGDLVFLQAGTSAPIHTRYGITDTTRTKSSDPNVQNIRRAARKDCLVCGRSAPAYQKRCDCGGADWRARQGIRECFVPRPGHCYVAIDHGGLELCTLAQCCVSLLGLADMATKINRGEDLHCHVAAQILGVPYERAVELKKAGDKALKNARNCGKVVNFGRPGGMSAATLVIYAKQSYGIEIDLPFAEQLIQHWNRANPDGVAFLRYVRLLKRGQRFDVRIPGTTIDRNQTTYCSAANCHFQGLGAALEAAVGWEIARQIYCGSGALSRCRLVNFIHDEFIVECPIGLQTEAAEELHAIMTGPVARAYLPDVRIEAEYAAMIRWSKAAEEKRSPDGRLLIHGLDY